MSEHKIPIPSRIYNAAVGGHVAGADQIIDDETGLTLDKVAGGALEEKEHISGSNNGMGRVVLRKNIVEGINTLIQSMINQSNTIYIIQYDFTLGENITIPENCVLKFDGGSVFGEYTITGQNTIIKALPNKIFNINVLFEGSFISESVYPEWFGAIGDGTTIDDDSFSKTADFINNNVNGLVNLQFGHKHYKFNSGIQIKKDIVIDGNGTTLEYTVDTSQTQTYIGLQISKDNPITLLDAGTVAATKDTKIITTTNSVDLVEGDYIIIEDTTDYSWVSSRAYYHAGDILRVKSISGTTITVTENITQTYSGANIVLRKLNTIKASVSNINFICHHDGINRTSNGIFIICGVDSILSNIRGEGSFHSHFSIEFCYGASILNCFVDTETPICGLNYGVVISTSKHVTVSNCFLKATRHGLTTGGGDIGIPNRYITITNSIFDTYGDISSLDTHENGEFVLVDNCIVKGGFSVGTLSTVVKNCEIFTKPGCGYGIITQNKCRDITILNNIFKFEQEDYTGSVATLILLKSPSENNTDTITIKGNTFYGGGKNADSYGGCIKICDGSKFYNINIENNNFYKAADETNNVVAIMLRNFSANLITIKGNYNNISWFMNTNTMYNNTDISFINNVIEGKNIAINTYQFKYVKVIGNYIANLTDCPIFVNNPVPTEQSPTNYDDKILIVSKNIIINCNKVGNSSSVYDTPFKIQQLKEAIIVDNIVCTDRTRTSVSLYRYRFEGVEKAIYQNNKFWSNIDTYEGTVTGITTLINKDLVDNNFVKNVGASRPENVQKGYMYFDESLSKPIWSDGTGGWIDATGATV